MNRVRLASVYYFLGQASERPEVEYDEFHDSTRISMSLGKLPDEVNHSSMAIWAFHHGKKPAKFHESRLVYIDIYRRGKGWRFLDNHDLKIMVEYNHIPVSGHSYKPDVDSVYCHEHIVLGVRLKTMKEFLAKQKDWEVKSGATDLLRVGSQARAKMLAFVRFLEEGQG
jgi:hypothetical protein